MKTISTKKSVSPVQLVWTHLGELYRVTAWPEAKLESFCAAEWNECVADPSSDVIAAAAGMLDRFDWSRYLEFVPSSERRFLETFRFGRMAALIVITRCPELLADLQEAPALTSFLAAHTRLRGGLHVAWTEINAVHERSGIFGVLQWLGLPANRVVLETLQNFAEPDIAKRLLDRVRASLWSPLAPALLRDHQPLSEVNLMTRCEVIAA